MPECLGVENRPVFQSSPRLCQSAPWERAHPQRVPGGASRLAAGVPRLEQGADGRRPRAEHFAGGCPPGRGAPAWRRAQGHARRPPPAADDPRRRSGLSGPVGGAGENRRHDHRPTAPRSTRPTARGKDSSLPSVPDARPARLAQSGPRQHPPQDRPRRSSGLEKKLPAVVAEHLAQPQAHGKKPRLMFQDEARCRRMSRPRRCWPPPAPGL